MLAVVLVAFVPRAFAADWGGRHPDERVSEAARVLSGNLQPLDHFYPQLLHHTNAVAIGIKLFLGLLTGAYSGIVDFKAHYFTDEMSFLVACRLMQAALSSLGAAGGYLGARALGISRLWALGAALVVILLPVNVYMAHISKPQDGMTAMLALATGAIFALIHAPSARRAALVGALAGAAQAFLQSAVLLAAPLLVCAAGLVWMRARSDFPKLAGWVLVGGILSWSALSLVTLAYLPEFFEYQVIQSQMSIRESSSGTFFRVALPLLASWWGGMSPVGLALALLVLYVCRESSVRALGLAALLATIAVALLVGERVRPRLFLSFCTVNLLISSVGLAWVAEKERGFRSWVGRGGLAVMVAGMIPGLVMVLGQASAPPAAELVSEAVAGLEPDPDSKILVSNVARSGLVPSLAARDAAFARHQRLADKYGLTLPARSRERRMYDAKRKDTIFVREIPWVIGGLQFLDPEEVKIVKPFAWPVQHEEWKLGHWLAKGYDVFVLDRLEAHTSDEVPDYMAAFHESIIEQCELVEVIDVDRPLFFEEDFSIFDCASVDR